MALHAAPPLPPTALSRFYLLHCEVQCIIIYRHPSIKWFVIMVTHVRNTKFGVRQSLCALCHGTNRHVCHLPAPLDTHTAYKLCCGAFPISSTGPVRASGPTPTTHVLAVGDRHGQTQQGKPSASATMTKVCGSCRRCSRCASCRWFNMGCLDECARKLYAMGLSGMNSDVTHQGQGGVYSGMCYKTGVQT